MRWISFAGVGVLIAAMLVVGTASPAKACACGGVVSSDSAARVADEEALLATNGDTETVVMRLNLRSTADNAALIVPTPTPAEVSLASPSLFDELEALTAPRVETRRHWSFSGGLDAAGAPTAQGPTVISQVQLGPLEATTLAGGDLPGVQQWLQSHGYTMRPEVVAQLDPYLQQGWAFVAMRLTASAPLDGPLAPVKLVFASDRLVYPMRMSAAAQTPQRVVIYTLGAHRMQRTDPDTAAQSVDVDYAGSISGRSRDQTLTELSRDGAFLTRISVQISDPSAITSDFFFGPAAADDPYQRVVYRDEFVDLTPFLLAAGLLVVVFASIAGAVGLIIRSRRRRRRAG